MLIATLPLSRAFTIGSPDMRLAALLSIIALTTRAAEWQPIQVPSPSASAAPSWLRVHVRVQDNMTDPKAAPLWRNSVTLSFAETPPFSVFVNGTKIAESAAVGTEAKRVKVPPGVFEHRKFNTLVVRLDGAMGRAPILAGYFDEVKFAGAWMRATTEPTADEMKPLDAQPAAAFFTEKDFRPSTTPLAVTEHMPGARMSPADSFATLKAGDGLVVEPLLAEPLVAQPTHMSFDERGRLWVSQYRQYPYPAGVRQISRDMYYRAVFDKVPPPPPNHDKGADIISVHEDTDGDGTFDKHTNVLTGLNMANAAVRGAGGLWVMHTPYLLFYPDTADGTPGTPEVRLAGFGLEDTHSIANGLVWGPDGWLYGGQGSTTTCRVVSYGRPGFEKEPPVYFEGCMVWRYHPRTRAFEIFAEGGGNTFGLEFDAEGNLFSGHNGGETRGWHFIQSGIYLKQGKEPGKFGGPTNPFSFGEFGYMKSANPVARFTHNLIVAEGTAMPSWLRGQFLGAGPRHRNLVAAERIAAGPTFTTKDTGIALSGADIAFRPVYLANAPDGSVYVADFYEEYIAHGQNYQGQLDPTTGRIYRLRGKGVALEKDINLSRKTTDELIALLRHPNRWHRWTAVRLLGERRDKSAVPKLRAMLAEKETHPALEALWALHQMEEFDETTLVRVYREHPSPHVRAWCIRVMGDAKTIPERFYLQAFNVIEEERDSVVLAQIASTAMRLSVHESMFFVDLLASWNSSADDSYIPLFCWWAIERSIPAWVTHELKKSKPVESDSDEPQTNLPAEFAPFWKTRLAQEHLAVRLGQRLASNHSQREYLLLSRLLNSAPANAKKQLIAGFEAAFKGRAIPPLPDELLAALAKAGSGSLAFRVRQGEAAALAESLTLIADAKAKPEERALLIRTLGEAKASGAIQPLLALATGDASADIRKAALSALLPFDDANIAKTVAANFAKLPPAAQPAAVTLLASRDASRGALLSLVESGALKAGDVPPDAAAWLREKSTDREKAARLFPATPSAVVDRAKFDAIRAIIAKGAGNAYDGEATFMARCAACHQLFHKGGKIGPNLTAYQREDLGTMLTSILAPGAEIREGFENFTVTTKDGRTLSGFVTDKDANVVTLRGLDGQDIALPRAQIAEMKSAGRSLMPDGLLEGLTDQQLRDFFAYLRIPQPITR
jgi:putative heme-binding domain-containing protein